ncbi:hypothetical protein E8E14_010324 [Neopestalotiopsis sp. 37M]|nr:hypothetical protein E8E14_010324 [Neopestalotiopsis sp. 37M]
MSLVTAPIIMIFSNISIITQAVVVGHALPVVTQHPRAIQVTSRRIESQYPRFGSDFPSATRPVQLINLSINVGLISSRRGQPVSGGIVGSWPWTWATDSFRLSDVSLHPSCPGVIPATYSQVSRLL